MRIVHVFAGSNVLEYHAVALLDHLPNILGITTDGDAVVVDIVVSFLVPLHA